MFMQSSGGLTAANLFQGKDAILSGPAGGVVGAAETARMAGADKIIGFDMGGTSTDVSHFAGAFERAFETEVAGVRMRAPMMRIHTVAAGQYYLCQPIIQCVIESLVLNESDSESRMFSVLTPREREVAQLLSEGLSTRLIAKRLNLSVKTIDTHRYQVLKKLDLRGIADLTRLALREGLSSLDD